MDALFAFRQHGGCRVFYLNVSRPRVPRYLRLVDFDVVIFHTLFFASRWEPAAFDRLQEQVQGLRTMGALRVALPQDEFINSEGVNAFLARFDVGVVFSVQPENEWDNIYGPARGFAIYRVLTGYLDRARLEKIERFQGKRDIDIGYRTAGRPPAWFGRHGYLKADIARVVAASAGAYGLVTDISVEAADTLMGDDWYRFLCRCHYTLGVEGGTSILDRTGELRRRTDAFAAAHPDATFEEIEAACFPGLDGTFRGYAISPRHLEACAARVCQVLTEGDYNGILLPGRHYIELKKDFSNLEQVLARISTAEGRDEMTRRAYEDIVQSQQFTYDAFVEGVFTRCAQHLPPAHASEQRGLRESVVYAWTRVVEQFDRLLMLLHRKWATPLRQFLRRRSSVGR
jgi:hypothetical protein